MDYQDEPPWRAFELFSEGRSVEELIESAVYWQIDQDGGSLGSIPADDPKAVEYIIEWCKKRGVPETLEAEEVEEIDPESGMRLADLRRPRR
jgi:hypothetical protein